MIIIRDIFIQGDGKGLYPPTFKYPLILYLTRQRNEEGYIIPKIYGLAWYNFNCDYQVLMWIPFNFIVSWVIQLYEGLRWKWIKKSTSLDLIKQKAWLEGRNKGYEQGCKWTIYKENEDIKNSYRSGYRHGYERGEAEVMNRMEDIGLNFIRKHGLYK